MWGAARVPPEELPVEDWHHVHGRLLDGHLPLRYAGGPPDDRAGQWRQHHQHQFDLRLFRHGPGQPAPQRG